MEQSGDDDYQAMLCYNLERQMRDIFEQFCKESKPQQAVFDYGKRLIRLEAGYEKEGLSCEEIREVRRRILNDR